MRPTPHFIATPQGSYNPRRGWPNVTSARRMVIGTTPRFGYGRPGDGWARRVRSMPVRRMRWAFVQPLRGWAIFMHAPIRRLHLRLFMFVPFGDPSRNRPPDGPGRAITKWKRGRESLL